MANQRTTGDDTRALPAKYRATRKKMGRPKAEDPAVYRATGMITKKVDQALDMAASASGMSRSHIVADGVLLWLEMFGEELKKR